MRSILFVCSANVCRSPLAMGLLRLKVDNELSEWDIHSAGVWAENGWPAARYTLEVLTSRGYDLENHLSQQVNREMVENYNLVLTMERGQKEALQIAFPDLTSRFYLLSEMVGKSHEIKDPIGRSFIDFEHTADEIDQILNDGFERIKELAAPTAE